MKITHLVGCALLFLASGMSASAEPTALLDPSAVRLTWSEDATKETKHVTASSAEQVSQFHTGDTAYYLCVKKVFQFGTGAGTDCFGYRAPNGTEYAIFGIHNGVAVINTSNLTVVGTTIGPENGCGGDVSGPRWRDMKAYRRYVYASSECTGTNQGIMIFNMTNLPTSYSYVGSIPVIPSLGYYSCHNLSIDTMKGYMYLEALESPGYTISIYNVGANQANPTFVRSFGINLGDNGIHDIFAYNDTMFLAEGYNHSFSIYNMADKNNPILLARVPIPASGYVHNIWPSGDLKYCATTEETPGKTIKIWDLHNLSNIQLISEYLAPNGLAHNTHWKGDKLYTSHYESGVTVVDVSDPSNPRQLTQFDTWATENSDYNGCWGAYPFTANGLVYASNMDGKMYVFQEHTDIISDSMWAETTYVAAGNQAVVDIYAKNSLPTRQFTIPINWAGPYNMGLADLTRVGTRTEYFESESVIASDPANSRMVVSLKSSSNGTSPDLPPGTGKIYSFTFDVPGGASGAINKVSFTPYVYGGGQHTAAFATDCLIYFPDTISGGVKLNSGGCCVGTRGDVNDNGGANPNVLDINYLVAYFFGGGPAPHCTEEADVNSSNSLNVLDLNYLVAYIFAGGPAPGVCP